MTKEQLKTMLVLHAELRHLYERHERLSKPLKPGKFNTPWRRAQYAAWKKDVEDQMEKKSSELGDLIEALYRSFDAIKDIDVHTILWLRYAYGLKWDEVGKRFGRSRATVRRKVYQYFKDCTQNCTLLP